MVNGQDAEKPVRDLSTFRASGCAAEPTSPRVVLDESTHQVMHRDVQPTCLYKESNSKVSTENYEATLLTLRFSAFPTGPYNPPPVLY